MNQSDTSNRASSGMKVRSQRGPGPLVAPRPSIDGWTACTIWAGVRGSARLSSSRTSRAATTRRWEAATRLLFRVILARELPNGSDGALRHAIERMDPVLYLNSSYYARWVTAAATLAVEAGIVTQAELEERAGGPYPLSGPVTAEDDH